MHALRPGWTIGILLAIGILCLGLSALVLLISYFRVQLLARFSQKIRMTVLLGIAFSGIIALGSYGLIRYVSQEMFIEHFREYVQQPLFLGRLALSLFALNSILILALRSVIKELCN